MLIYRQGLQAVTLLGSPATDGKYLIMGLKRYGEVMTAENGILF